MPSIENRPFNSLEVGEEIRLVHTLSSEDFSLLATQAATIGRGRRRSDRRGDQGLQRRRGANRLGKRAHERADRGTASGRGLKARPADCRDHGAGAAGRRADGFGQGHGQNARRTARHYRSARDQPAWRPGDGGLGGNRRAEEGHRRGAARGIRRADAREGAALQDPDRTHPRPEAPEDGGRASGRRSLADRRDRGGARGPDGAGARRSGSQDSPGRRGGRPRHRGLSDRVDRA